MPLPTGHGALQRFLQSASTGSLPQWVRESIYLDSQHRLTFNELIRNLAFAFKDDPQKLQPLNSFLPPDHYVHLVTDSGAVRMIVVQEPDSARIHVIDPSCVEGEFPSSLSELRTLLNDPICGYQQLCSFSPLVAKAVLQLLQWELDHKDTDRQYTRRCLQIMRRLAKTLGVLPPSFYLAGVVREGKFPITGGGFADIWKGRLGSSSVCLKVLRIFTTETRKEKIIKEFCHEALLWRQLSHPNLLPFFGVSEDLFAPSFCLISPFLENGNIIQFLEKHPEHDRITCLLEIAQGLQYLHSLDPQIIHGDIRGANILVDDDGVCRLADFGLALVSETQPLESTSAAKRGTTRWLAPELIDPRGYEGQYIPPTSRDIYAFGFTIVEIFTGKPPFAHHKMDSAVMYDVLKGIRIERSEAPSIPSEFWDIIECCWSGVPCERPSIHEVVEMIQQCQERTVVATHSGQSTRLISVIRPVPTKMSKLAGSDYGSSPSPCTSYSGPPAPPRPPSLTPERMSAKHSPKRTPAVRPPLLSVQTSFDNPWYLRVKKPITPATDSEDPSSESSGEVSSDERSAQSSPSTTPEDDTPQLKATYQEQRRLIVGEQHDQQCPILAEPSSSSGTRFGPGQQPFTEVSWAAIPIQIFRECRDGDPAWRCLAQVLHGRGKQPSEINNYVLMLSYQSSRMGGTFEICLRDDDKALELYSRYERKRRNPHFYVKHVSDLPSPVVSARNKDEFRMMLPDSYQDLQSPTAEEASGEWELLDPVQDNPTYVFAIYPHVARKDGEMTVVAGESYMLLSRGQSLWNVQSIADPDDQAATVRHGQVPSSCFLEILDSTPDGRNKLHRRISPRHVLSPGFRTTVLKGFAPTLHGNHEMRISKGERVLVYKKYDHWCYAIKEKTFEHGWIPGWLIAPPSSSSR